MLQSHSITSQSSTSALQIQTNELQEVSCHGPGQQRISAWGDPVTLTCSLAALLTADLGVVKERQLG